MKKTTTKYYISAFAFFIALIIITSLSELAGAILASLAVGFAVGQDTEKRKQHGN